MGGTPGAPVAAGGGDADRLSKGFAAAFDRKSGGFPHETSSCAGGRQIGGFLGGKQNSLQSSRTFQKRGFRRKRFFADAQINDHRAEFLLSLNNDMTVS